MNTQFKCIDIADAHLRNNELRIIIVFIDMEFRLSLPLSNGLANFWPSKTKQNKSIVSISRIEESRAHSPSHAFCRLSDGFYLSHLMGMVFAWPFLKFGANRNCSS